MIYSNIVNETVFPVHSYKEFIEDYKSIDTLSDHGPTTSFCMKALELLELKYRLYELLNSKIEKYYMKAEKIFINSNLHIFSWDSSILIELLK
jgi:hypothetical protein